jgi:esterase/lipase superfamily enzyme
MKAPSVVLLLLTFAFTSQAATLSGTVRDSEGAVIAKAHLVVHLDRAGSEYLGDNVGIKEDITVNTDSDGKFSLDLPDTVRGDMLNETEFYSFRWVKRFVRIDAEQPVGTARMVLSFLRTNQWALFELTKIEAKSRFYACQKREIQRRLENAESEVPVGKALDFERSSPSQEVVARVAAADLPINAAVNPAEPWLNRLILTDQHGEPLAIGVPTVRQRYLGKAGPADAHGVVRYELARDILTYETSTPVKESGPEASARQEYTVVRVFYGTDRSKAGNGYSNRREKADSLHFGTCDITIPRDHRLARLESPKWWKFDFSWNPGKHVTLQRIIELSKPAFLTQLQSTVLEAADRSALVFIHGYNVSFEDGARRTAQLSYDLGFKGAPILYSWPSANSVSSYLADEATIDWTKPHLSSFLADVASITDAQTVYVIAHSMGNRALARILDGISLPVGLPLFEQIVLAAPDIDSGEFLHLAKTIQCKARRVTLYASSNDQAIKLSKEIHEYPRAGESGSDIVVVPGLDTIDASNVDTSLLGHSYFAERRTVISDLFYLIRDGKGPEERHSLEPKTCPQGQYWAFKP